MVRLLQKLWAMATDGCGGWALLGGVQVHSWSPAGAAHGPPLYRCCMLDECSRWLESHGAVVRVAVP